MKCPYCGFEDTRVIDSRPNDEKIKRRRECVRCSGRFTTFEEIESPLLMVEKRSGGFEPFDKSKLIKGIFTAIKKRPVTNVMVEEIADHVENSCADKLRTVISSREIGEIVLERLREIDPVAYIRFASVYKDFNDIESFVAAISEFDSIK